MCLDAMALTYTANMNEVLRERLAAAANADGVRSISSVRRERKAVGSDLN